jgi:hypothetical protein
VLPPTLLKKNKKSLMNFTPSPTDPPLESTGSFETSFSPGQIIIIVGIIKLILLALFQSFRAGHFKCDSCCGLCGFETSLIGGGKGDIDNNDEENVISSRKRSHSEDGRKLPDIHIHVSRSRGDSDPPTIINKRPTL